MNYKSILISSVVAIAAYVFFTSAKTETSGKLPTNWSGPPTTPYTFSSPPSVQGSYTIFPGEYLNQCLDNVHGVIYQADYVFSAETGGFTTAGVLTANSGAHHQAVIDKNGELYMVGDNTYGECLNGNTSGVSTYFHVIRDSIGNTQPGAGKTWVQVVCYAANSGQWNTYVLRSDGTVWIGGSTVGVRGIAGYGGSSTNSYLVQIPFPGGTFISRISSDGNMLDSAGNIWSPSSATGAYTQITLPSRCISYLYNSGFGDYAYCANGHTYGWSAFGAGVIGIGPPDPTFNVQFRYENPFSIGSSHSYVLLDTAWNLPLPIAIGTDGQAKLYANDLMSYAILTDSSLWAWGDFSCGEGGNGIAPNWASPPGANAPWSWDQNYGACWNGQSNSGSTSFFQYKPHQIMPGTKFIHVYTGASLVYYTYADDSAGNMYSWGRGKAGLLCDQRGSCDRIIGTIDAQYPNSFDRPTICRVNLVGAFGTSITNVSSPFCIANPGNANCTCTVPPAATVVAAFTANTSSNSVFFNASTTTNTGGYGWFRFRWIPVNILDPIMESTTDTVTLYGFTPGTHQYNLEATDIRFDIATTSTPVSFTISGGTPSSAHLIRRRGYKLKLIP